MCYKPHTEHTHNTHNTLCAEGTAEKIPLCISLAHLHLGSLNVPTPAPALAICHLMLAVRMAFNSSFSLSPSFSAPSSAALVISFLWPQALKTCTRAVPVKKAACRVLLQTPVQSIVNSPTHQSSTWELQSELETCTKPTTDSWIYLNDPKRSRVHICLDITSSGSARLTGGVLFMTIALAELAAHVPWHCVKVFRV